MNNLLNIFTWLSGVVGKTILITTAVLGTLHYNASSTKIIDQIPVENLKTAEQNVEKITSLFDINSDLGMSEKTPFSEVRKKINQLSVVAPTYTSINNSNTKVVIKNKEAAQATSTKYTGKIMISGSNYIDSVINIRCEEKISNTSTRIITGSGILISKDGLILTVAHVAAPLYSSQNSKRNFECYGRSGSPAGGKYPLKLVYINKLWTDKYLNIFDKGYTESGENDIAILSIDNSLSLENLTNINQKTFVLPEYNVNKGDLISIISYPADVYEKLGAFSPLSRQLESNTIADSWSFNNLQDKDVLETNPSVIAQSGASGGGIFNQNGKLIGLIVSMVPSDILLKEKIRALSSDYIKRTLYKDGVSVVGW